MTDSALVLDDGTVYPGRFFGTKPPRAGELACATSRPAGEVVFNTGMAGYQEVLTDPSYVGQIVTMTYPLIGNYGIDPAYSETGAERGVDRRRVKVDGFVVRELYRGPVPSGRTALAAYLESEGATGIEGVDTRALTLKLRDGGNRNGVIIALAGREAANREKRQATDYLRRIPPMEGANLVGKVGTARAETLNADGRPHFVLFDCGCKRGILENLAGRGVRVSILPSSAASGEVLNLKPDGVLFSNGPGDPAVLKSQIDCVRGLLGKTPVFGICLGHQMIGLALGAKTFKMGFGHHGVNHPVVDEETGRVYVTSQNHGFAVEEKGLPDDAVVWFRNANDKTVEGLRHRRLPLLSVQFHPEARPGPGDSGWVFDAFLNRAAAAGGS